MRNSLFLAFATIVACASFAAAQDDGELRMRKALEGRFVLLKMDLPAVEAGLPLVFDDANVSFDDAAYKKLLKEYGTSVKAGSRAKITGVRISAKGIEVDLDGGGSPGRDWVVAGVTLTQPLLLPRSERETDLERQLQLETNTETATYLRGEIEYESGRRLAQDERNREAFQRFKSLRSEYIEKNRPIWGSKLIFVVRSRKPSVTMRDMMKSLSKYVEILPREPASE